MDCPCGAKAPVFQLKETSFMVHCPACGALTFFHNPQLLERLRYGGRLCHHPLVRKPCRGGSTTWCPICRLRTFYYDGGEQDGSATST